jgi:hypothetical protein
VKVAASAARARADTPSKPLSSILLAVQGGFLRTAGALLNPEGSYTKVELSICDAIHAGDLPAAQEQTKLAQTDMTKLMERAAESDLVCFQFGAELGKTTHLWLRDLDSNAAQTLPGQPTPEQLVTVGTQLQELFLQRLHATGAAPANLHVGPVKTVKSATRKMQDCEPSKMMDINRASLYTNNVEDFDFLQKLEAGHVPGLRVCRAKVGEEATKWPRDHTSLVIPPNLFLNLLMTPLQGTCATCMHAHSRTYLLTTCTQNFTHTYTHIHLHKHKHTVSIISHTKARSGQRPRWIVGWSSCR